MCELDAHTRRSIESSPFVPMETFEATGALNLQGLMGAGLEARTLGLTLFSLPPALEASYARTARLTHDTGVKIVVDDTGNAARKARNRRNAVAERVVSEQRCEPARGASRRRRDSSITFTNVAI